MAKLVKDMHGLLKAKDLNKVKDVCLRLFCFTKYLHSNVT